LETLLELVWDIIINLDFHPFFVHFPISLFFTAFLLELFKTKVLWIHNNIPIFLFALASFFTIPSSFTGDSAEIEARQIIGISDVLSNHEKVATIVTITAIFFSFLLIFIDLKYPSKSINKLKKTIFLLMTLMVFYTGFLGGKMVQEFGAGVNTKLEQRN